MCSISHDLQAIFIHIPKCGGLFVEKILTDFYNFTTFYFTHENHCDFIDVNEKIDEEQPPGFLCIKKHGILRYFMSSVKHSEKQNMNMEKWNQYNKFTFIRNPYDKIVSAWKYINKISLEPPITFRNFLRSKDTCNPFTYFHAFITQYEHLLNINNELKIDFFGKFEELNDNLSNILLRLNEKIKHSCAIKTNKKKNSSGDSINYVEYYTDDLIQIVNELFEIDFIKFGFKKCNNMDELTENSALYFVSDEMFVSNNEVLLNKLTSNNNIDISEEVKDNIKYKDNEDIWSDANDEEVGKENE